MKSNIKKIMKTVVGATILTSMILTGCSENSDVINTSAQLETTVSVELTATPSPEPTTSTEPSPTPSSEPTATPEVQATILQEEFHKANKVDPDWPSFPNGKYQLQDDSIVYADQISYVDGAFYEYATVTFYEGKLAAFQVETELSIEEVKKGLGLTYISDETIIEQTMSG